MSYSCFQIPNIFQIMELVKVAKDKTVQCFYKQLMIEHSLLQIFSENYRSQGSTCMLMLTAGIMYIKTLTYNI